MTEDIEAIAKRLVVGHKRDGRSVYDVQAKTELVRACRQPGVSLAGIARTCGINANVLGNWVRLQERGKPGGAAPRGEVIEMPPPAFVAVQMPSAAAAPPVASGLEVQIRLPNGVTVEMSGYDPHDTIGLIEARLDEGLKVYLHREPIDFRLNINGLSVLVEKALGLDPFAACAYVFSNRRRNRAT
jgi:transposase